MATSNNKTVANSYNSTAQNKVGEDSPAKKAESVAASQFLNEQDIIKLVSEQSVFLTKGKH